MIGSARSIRLTISSVDFPTFKPDTEPWTSTISLAGTRVDLPATPASVSGEQKEGSGVFGGAMTGWLWLSLFGVMRRKVCCRENKITI